LKQATPSGEDSKTDDGSTISQRHLEQVHDMVADAMLDLPSAPNVNGLLESVLSCELQLEYYHRQFFNCCFPG